ncbi:serine racemase isoform X1 [Aquila chrysaetos chrysaetos]|uniref:serine racemase isoform X1 n=1 Tax=Aquila chrysaetos chrysaetos TaxID=223781 RepID=UPI0011769002|nr:serine racemase isoform X1 [Aquila chrysaetos chrysaetos]
MAGPPRLALAEVRAAEERLRGRLHRTPLLTSGSLDRLAGRRLLFKCELFQRTGSFKIRGALNAVRSLVEESKRAGGGLPRAVVTHSSGNHGQALACAAQAEGIPAYIVVPRTAPHCKQAAIRTYGATLVPCEPNDKARAETASCVVQETGGVMVHPNQEPAVIAGQGTIALEVLEQVRETYSPDPARGSAPRRQGHSKNGYPRCQKQLRFLSAQAPEVNAIVAPVGGGGMIAGIAVAIKALRPDVKVFAAEPRNADDCYQSKVRGELTPNLHPPDTIADAVKTSIGPNTWPIIRDLVDDVLTVSEEEIKQATRLVWERMKLLIEPTAGVGVAAVLSEQFQAVPRDAENVCIVLCGGNVDLSSLTWLTDLPGKVE